MATDSRENAIAQLFQEHGGLIYNLGLRVCNSPDEAEDLVQETFLRAFNSWDKFEGRSDATTWMYTIAVRACRRMHRKRAGEPSHMQTIDQLLPDEGDGVVDVPAPDDGPLDDVLRKEAQGVVDRAIGKLPVSFRLALVLKDIAELSINEVADILGVKPATVKTRVHRARLLLRKELADSLPQRSAPHPDHPREVCLNLLQAKQEAMDRGAPFPVPREELCERCEALFRTLDLAHEACLDIRQGMVPDRLRKLLKKKFAA